MKTYILSLLFFLLVSINLSAQNAHVISPNGLNMRVRPDIYGKKLLALPFLTEVEIIDTVQNTLYQTALHTFYNWEGKNAFKIPIKGKWLKIKYKEYTGYVLSPFVNGLAYKIYKPIKETSYRLLFPGESCFDNIPANHNELFWYGLYRDGTQFELRPVTISYFMKVSELSWLVTSAKENKNLVFIVGMPEKARYKEVKGTEKMPGRVLSPWSLKQTFFTKRSKLRLSHPCENPTIKLIAKGIEQSLDIPDIDLSYPMDVRWYGDLDGDNRQDYLIQYGDKVSQIVLYLSSVAPYGQLVKPVAIYYSGYCC